MLAHELLALRVGAADFERGGQFHGSTSPQGGDRHLPARLAATVTGVEAAPQPGPLGSAARTPTLEARVGQGKTEEAKLGVANPLWVTVPRGRAGDVKPIAKRPAPLLAPLGAGEKVGTLTLMLDNKLLRSEPLEVLEAVERAGFVGRTVDTVKLWFRKSE